MDNTYEEIYKEQYFPYLYMTIDERDFCLKILENCKDIVDSDFKINGIGKCSIVEMHFKKENGVIHTSGSLIIGDDTKKECRTIETDIYVNNERIIVDMLIERLNVFDENKKYRVLDEFKLENNKLRRKSQYNFDMENLHEIIEDEEMKGRLK